MQTLRAILNAKYGHGKPPFFRADAAGSGSYEPLSYIVNVSA